MLTDNELQTVLLLLQSVALEPGDQCNIGTADPR